MTSGKKNSEIGPGHISQRGTTIRNVRFSLFRLKRSLVQENKFFSQRVQEKSDAQRSWLGPREIS